MTTRAIEKGYKEMFESLLPSLEALLQQRVDRAQRDLNITVNYDFALVEPARLAELITQVCAPGDGQGGDAPQAAVTYCTNLRAAQLAQALEQQTGVPLLDTVCTTVWGMLRAAGADPAQVTGWGQLFQWR